MNDRDDSTLLAKNVHALIQNFYPDTSGIPRNGINEKLLNSDPIGRWSGSGLYGHKETLFVQRPVHVHMGGKDFLFAWHQVDATPGHCGLEVWNVTDLTRTWLFGGDFGSANTVYASMRALYDALYVTLEYEMQTSFENAYRTRNKILEYDADSDSWIIREYGLDVAPEIPSAFYADAMTVPLTGRRYHSATVFNGYIYIIGGQDADGYVLDIQRSDDGYRFSHIEPTENGYTFTDDGEIVVDDEGNPVMIDCTGEFYARAGHCAVVYDGKLWVLGGVNDAGELKDVWFTVNGTDWIRADHNADFGVRKFASCAVFNNLLYVIAGNDGSSDLNDVWYTDDGYTWTEATAAADFSARSGHTSLTYDNKLWVICGGKVDVYSSVDGETWTEATADANMGAVGNHCSLVRSGKMWTLTGVVGSSKMNDVYYSTDGATWTLASSTPGFTDRAGSAVLEFDDAFYLYLGDNGVAGYSGDIYTSTDGATWTSATDGITAGKYISLAFTYVRRTDEYATLASVAEHKYETWESLDGELIVGVDEKLLTGTVSLSGAALTGSGTAFLAELEVGAYIRIDGDSTAYEVTEVTDDTNAVVTNPNSDTHTAKNFALLPSIGDPITTTDFQVGLEEGAEDSTLRRVVWMGCSTDFGRIFIRCPSNAAEATAKGATHCRVYRTEEAETYALAQGLTHRFAVDIAISGDSFTADKIYREDTTNATIIGETNTLDTTGIDVPPMGRFLDFDRRAWVGGCPDNPGYWFFSDEPANVQYPQKYASQFRLTSDFITCDPADGQKDAGTVLHGGDRYFFKQRKIFRLVGADPNNAPEKISDPIGCAFPETITRIHLTDQDIDVIGFVSEVGPAFLLPGGQIQLVEPFTIASLWPDETGIIRKVDGSPTDWYSRNRVAGAFWDGVWWIQYGDSRDAACGLTANKIYGFRIGDKAGVQGPFELTLKKTGGKPIVELINLVPVNNVEAYCLVHYGTHTDGVSAIDYRLIQFLDPTVWKDTLTDHGAHTYEMVAETAYRFLDPLHMACAKIAHGIVEIEFDDTDGLTVTVTSDGGRIVGPCTYSQKRQSGIAADNAYRRLVGVRMKGAMIGDRFKIRIAKTVPADGDVELFGAFLQGDPHHREIEFFDATADVNADTVFVVKADDDPEEEVN
jgi:hypothetical protein